jgi:hypothetical protein
MKPVRRTALQGEAIGDGEAIQGLGKGLDRSRYGGTRKGEPSQVRASQKTEGYLKITRGMTTTPIAERTS